MASILIIEDDANIARLIQEQLQFEGHSVVHTSSMADAMTALTGQSFDLLVLDIGLPDGNGFELCQRVRASGVGAPILVLTARHQTIDKVRALDIGADDYLTKPFDLQELVARVRALLRRAERPRAAGRQRLRFGGLEVDTARRSVKLDGRELTLTGKEYGLLKLLVEAAGSVVSRDQILDRLWPDVHVTPRSVDVHVSALRRKLRDDPARPTFIVSVRGVGYRLREVP